MNQINTTRTILAVIIAVALVVSVGSLTALYTFPADATKPKHNDDDDDNGSGNSNVVNTLPQQPQLAPLSMETAPNTGGNVESDDVATLQQQAQPQPQQQAQQPQPQQAASTNAACGQVVSGVVNLTANLNCNSGDGIIVGGPNTVINMNGFSITGPGQDSSKVGIMVPNVDNVVVNGPGSLSNFQAGVLLTGANGFTINSVILSNNQIGTFMTGAENAQVKQNIHDAFEQRSELLVCLLEPVLDFVRGNVGQQSPYPENVRRQFRLRNCRRHFLRRKSGQEQRSNSDHHDSAHES